MVNVVKVTRDGWVAAARDALIEDGVAGIKIDTLARRLGVSRGGFYYNFKNQQEVLDALLAHWKQSNDFLPSRPTLKSAAEAAEYLDRVVTRLILEEEFSPAFDLAIREWARIDPIAHKTVEAVDKERVRRLVRVFSALGCDREEAETRARILYLHQIGYYALGYHLKESREDRLAKEGLYLRILCGRRLSDALSESADKWV
jgi:AcrR family transcriptional regulator